jgi:DNA gyrase/topoisomerase IV subunit B
MATRKADYSESSIRVLKGLEPVRQRPGMYTRTENPLHIIQEVIDVLAILNALRLSFSKEIPIDTR